MRKRIFSIGLMFLLVLMFNSPLVRADERDEEVADLKTQVQELLKRIERLEKEEIQAKGEQAKVKEAPKALEACRVELEKVTSKLKLKGRWAAGYYKSGKRGSYQAGSFEAPEAKIQFTFEPDDINKIIIRLNLNNAAFNNLDYFYVDSKLSKFFNLPFELNSRLGRFKLGFGEETWSDNPVESVLASNSAPKAGGNDEGLEFSGKIKLEKIGLRPLGWVFSISDGNSGVGSDTSAGKAFMGKFHYTPIDPLYLSLTYYDSGSLKASNSEISIAGLSARPTNATNWQREAWEIDARYDFGKGKKPLNPPAFSDSKAIVRLSLGGFHDTASPITSALERQGEFGFIEGTYNLNKKLYTAGRYSIVDLDGNTTASLNTITANKYERYSLGLGYRWSENTILKLGYDWNKTDGPNIKDADDDLLSAIVATQF